MDVIERGSKMKVFNNVHKARKIYSKFDLIACVSDVCKAKFTTKFGYFNNICTVYNPIPKDDIIKNSQESVNDIKFKNNESLNLITVGRLVEQKGYDRLIECCNKLINDDKLHFNLYIIGDGPDKNKLMEYLQGLGWTVSKLNIKAERMRKNPKEPQGEIETNGCRFVCSRKLAEKPVNVLVSREKLKEIADYNEIFKFE